MQHVERIENRPSRCEGNENRKIRKSEFFAQLRSTRFPDANRSSFLSICNSHCRRCNSKIFQRSLANTHTHTPSAPTQLRASMYPKRFGPCAIPGHFRVPAIPVRARARPSSARAVHPLIKRTQAHSSAPLLFFFLARPRQRLYGRSLLLRAEWALVDEILTSENRNPLRDLQRGSPAPSPSVLPSGSSLSLSCRLSNDSSGRDAESRKRERKTDGVANGSATGREKRNEGKRQRLGRSS